MSPCEGLTRPGSSRRDRLAGFCPVKAQRFSRHVSVPLTSAPGEAPQAGPYHLSSGRAALPDAVSHPEPRQQRPSPRSHVVTGHQARVSKIRAPGLLTQPQGSAASS